MGSFRWTFVFKEIIICIHHGCIKRTPEAAHLFSTLMIIRNVSWSSNHIRRIMWHWRLE